MIYFLFRIFVKFYFNKHRLVRPKEKRKMPHKLVLCHVNMESFFEKKFLIEFFFINPKNPQVKLIFFIFFYF
jgi:hypothetical protein